MQHYYTCQRFGIQSCVTPIWTISTPGKSSGWSMESLTCWGCHLKTNSAKHRAINHHVGNIGKKLSILYIVRICRDILVVYHSIYWYRLKTWLFTYFGHIMIIPQPFFPKLPFGVRSCDDADMCHMLPMTITCQHCRFTSLRKKDQKAFLNLSFGDIPKRHSVFSCRWI